MITYLSASRVKSGKPVYVGLSLLVFVLAACATGAASQTTAQAPASAPAAVEITATTVSPSPTVVSTPKPEPTAAVAVPTSTAEAGTNAKLPTSIFQDESLDVFTARLSQEGMEYLTEFVEEFSPRESGSEGERVAAEFLRQEFADLGYDSELQPFEIEFIARDKPAFILVSPEARGVRALPLGMSGAGDATAALVDVGQAFAEDIPEGGLEGKIALIERGVITFEEKIIRVTEAGAIGAVVYNNAPGGFGGTLMNEGQIPAVSITREEGEAILGLMQSVEVVGRATVEVDARDTQNVIAEKPGTSDDGKVVIIGAHYDTVANTQGAGDNSTGVTTLVQLAEELADRDFPFTLRFVLFGVEEIGLFGSRHYVNSLDESERDNIVAMLNFDALGAGEPSILGDSELTSKVDAYAEANEIEVSISPGLSGGSSDHASFQAVGIPAIFFFGDDFSVINSPADTLDLIQPEMMGIHSALGLALLDMLAMLEE